LACEDKSSRLGNTKTLALSEQQIDVTFHADGHQIVFESKNPQIHLQFSREINRILGNAENYIVSGADQEFQSVDMNRGKKFFKPQRVFSTVSE